MEAVNTTKNGLIQWEYKNPQHEAFWFEKVDGNELRNWANGQLSTCGVICFIYFLFVCLGPKWMKNRKAFELDKPLVLWNFFLALFSLAVVARMGPPLIHQVMQPDGYYRSICVLERLNYSTTFWGFLFVLSKVAELGDTVFIVLRKKPIIFLHVFHHFNMVWSTVYLFVQGEPSMQYPAIINSLVHTIMYSYYALKAMKIHLPLRVAMLITSLQICQFIWAILGQYQQLYHYSFGQGKPCLRTTNSIITTLVFGFAYLFLFVRLFYNSYILNEKKKTA